jgi:hypothetical protein
VGIKSVRSQREEKEFLSLPRSIYSHDVNWIEPLQQDIKKVFDPQKNPFFTHGECERWVLYNENNKIIGRIAAFINNRTAFAKEQPTGGCGFFECINDKQAAFTLFDTAKKWLQERGMEAMDGPINFGERNAWWGLLVEGFTPPTYQMNYNPLYYKDLFEAYGFKNYFEQYSYAIEVNAPRPSRYDAIVQRIFNNPDYNFRHLTFDKLNAYAADFMSIYNRAWSHHPGFKPMTEEQAWSVIKSMKPVMLDYLLWFAYYKNEPIAMFIMLPELNGWFKHVHGNLNLIGKLKFFWLKTFDTTNRKIFGIVFGVVPEFQNKGIEAAIVMAANKVVVPKKRWDELELTWVASFNPRMVKTCEILGGKIAKRHITYRKLFDETKEFTRHPDI